MNFSNDFSICKTVTQRLSLFYVMNVLIFFFAHLNTQVPQGQTPLSHGTRPPQCALDLVCHVYQGPLPQYPSGNSSQSVPGSTPPPLALL